VKKRYRLRSDKQFQRVRREGRSWAHPLLVLCVLPNDLEHNRFGFSASHWVGKAVVRNRAKRLMREATRLRQGDIKEGWDLVFIARGPIREASFKQVAQAVRQLLRRAGLLKVTCKETG
jgi:ribonuclease P protein component